MSEELLEKVVRTTEVNNGNTAGQGGLTYAQADKFIDYMWDATVLSSLVRKRRMKASTEEIDTIGVGSRILRSATEAVDTGVNQGVTFAKLSITVKKMRLDWELSTESLEDNIEGADFEDHVARMMATAAATDLEDVAINGDTASADPTLLTFDGWSKKARAGGHVVDHAGGLLDRVALNKALKAMPRKYKAKKAGMKFFSGSNAIQDYLFSLQQVENGFVSPESMAAAGVNAAVSPEGPAGFITANAFGIQLQEVPLFNEARDGDYDTDSGTSGVQLPASNIDHGELWLTFPDNLIWAVKRDIQVHREYIAKKDTWEYTVYVRQGVQIENLDSFVVVKNIRIAS